MASRLLRAQPTSSTPRTTTTAMATGKPTRRRSPLLPPLLAARAARATFRAESPLAMSLTRYRTRSPDPAVQTLFSGGGKAFD